MQILSFFFFKLLLVFHFFGTVTNYERYVSIVKGFIFGKGIFCQILFDKNCLKIQTSPNLCEKSRAKEVPLAYYVTCAIGARSILLPTNHQPETRHMRNEECS